MMKKKFISMLLCATMVTMLTTGCGSDPDANQEQGSGTDTQDDANTGDDKTGGGEDNSGGSNETIKLTLWGAEEDQNLLKELVGKFEDTYSDYKFDISIGVESESSAKDTVLTDIEAAADVYAFASDQLADLVKAGALANLDNTSEALTVANKTLDDVKAASGEAAAEAASINGSMYAFPMAEDNSYFLYYDSSVISEEGYSKLGFTSESSR